MTRYSLYLFILSVCAFSASCGSGSSTTTATNQAKAIAPAPASFNADSAYTYVKDQVNFGPRVPGSQAHRLCSDYIVSQLQRFGADTILTQTGLVTAHNGAQLPIMNIMGRFNPEAKDRVLLAAHYDTRPWADNESTEERRATPIPGANDGASGVGVILEIARQLGITAPGIGVDLLLVDAEDYGTSAGWGNNDETWCLGTQYWAERMPYTASNRPRFGIVLDMVGGRDARFHREYFSEKYARPVVDKVWGTAISSGYSDQFVNEVAGSIIDDHLFINRAGIPCIDIVECNSATTHTFPETWHTLSDDMGSIDRKSLKAAGQTVLNVIYRETPR